jgi:hypothetical protein
MERIVFFIIVFFCIPTVYSQPVFKNPGIPMAESFEISDFINNRIGFVTARVNSVLKEEKGVKYYNITVNEGNLFLNEIEINYSDLTTISEKRTDLRSKTVIECYSNPGGNHIHFLNTEKHIDKTFKTNEKNIYSRYAYFFSFRGFPFDIQNTVNFKSYMVEYNGNALTMKVSKVARQMVAVKAGKFDCYKLELSVAGWQSVFASDKFYVYFTCQSPHQFVKYEEKEDDGKWNANELLRVL